MYLTGLIITPSGTVELSDGKRKYIKINTEDLTSEPAFDHIKLAESLSKIFPEKSNPAIFLFNVEYIADGNMLLRVRGDLYMLDD